MKSVSNIQPVTDKASKAKSSQGNQGTSSSFSDAQQLARADMILKSTDQYEKWQSIRQENGKASIELAKKIIDRYLILENFRANQSFDSAKFNALNQEISGYGIFLSENNKNNFPIKSDKNFVSTSRLLEPVARETSPSASHFVPVLPGDEMVVDVVCGKYNLTPALIALGNEKQIMLPLGELSRILEFSIAADPKKGKAGGWFLSKERTFSLDTVSGKGSIQGKPISFSPDQIINTDADIYVDSKLLASWFPMDLSYDFTKQSVSVNPKEELPFQSRIERYLSWENRLRLASNSPQLPLKYPEYQFLETPFVDMGLSANYNGTSDEAQGNYYLHAKGDMAWMNSELYLSGDEDDNLETARLTLRREDPQENLLGSLRASQVEIGDIRVPDFPIAGGGKYERGARIANLPLNASSEYDNTFFEGSLAPGWDVEVYRNNVLLASQQVKNDGRYSFDQVPLYYGANNFTLKFYGPQGEVREEKKQILVGSDMIKPGHLHYQLSASQKDETLFDPGEIPNSAHKGSGRFLARYQYGLTPDLSLQGGFLSQKTTDGRHNYINAGASGFMAGAYLSGDLVFDLDVAGYAVQALGQKKAGPIDLRMRQQFFHDFSTSEITKNTNLLKSRTSLSAFGRIKNGFFTQDIPFSLNFTNTHRKNTSESSANANFSTRIKTTYLNTSIGWKDRDNQGDDADIEGSFNISSGWKDLRLRGSLEYDLHPEEELTRAKASVIKRINDELSAELSITHDMEKDNLTTASLGTNWDNKKWVLSPRVSYNSDDEFTASLMFNTSFGMEPRASSPVLSSTRMADKGGVSAQVFHDKNNNQIYDQGDVPIANAKVSALQANESVVTDEKGVAFIKGLRKNKITDIAVVRESLEDPYWEPYFQGNSVLPRPGHIDMIDIPVTSTGEIEGSLSIRYPDGSIKDINHAPLQLLNKDHQVVKEIKSEYDGFYLFEKVPPGNYKVRLEPEFEKTLKTASLEPIPVTISSEGNIVSGADLVFSPKGSYNQSGRGVSDKIAKFQDGEKAGIISVKPVPELKTIKDPAVLPELKEVSLVSVEEPHDLPDLPSVKTPVDFPESDVLSSKTYHGAAPATVSESYTKWKTDALNEKPLVSGLEKNSYEQDSSRIDSVGGISAAAGKLPYVSRVKGHQQYGTHLSSYRSMDKAAAGILYQVNKYKDVLSDSDFTIQKTDLGDKGSWYRVVAGVSSKVQGAEKLGSSIKEIAPYTRIISLDNASQKGVHLTSTRTMEGARQSIKKLQAKYPEALKDIPFSIVYKNLGEKGAWYRVVAGNFLESDKAGELASRIKHGYPYCKPVSIENTEQLTVHAASYRNLEKAVKGMRILAKETGIQPDHLSIRKVDLGGKGVWYRVMLGRFDDPEKARWLAEKIQGSGQYAKVMKFA